MEACPSDWHLPTKAEYETLFTAVGGSSTAGTMLKSNSGWYKSSYSGGSFSGQGLGAVFWCSTEYNSNDAYHMYLYGSLDDAYLNYDSKYYGFSVRCLRD